MLALQWAEFRLGDFEELEGVVQVADDVEIRAGCFARQLEKAGEGEHEDIRRDDDARARGDWVCRRQFGQLADRVARDAEGSGV